MITNLAKGGTSSELSELHVNGELNENQFTNSPPDITGLNFTVGYLTNKSRIKVSPSVYTNAGYQTVTFTFGGISTSKTVHVLRGLPIGGVIFYIDSTADGTYQFYDANGNPASAPTVGTDCTGWSYEVTGATKDKYYVYNTSAMFSIGRSGTQTHPLVAWTYLDITNQSYIDGTTYTSGLPSGKQEYEYYGYQGRVYESLDGTYTGTAIGTGKSNTSTMMSLRNGVYIQGPQIKWKSQTQYSETIWYICDQFNKGTYSLNGSPVVNNTGCNNWYIPSKDELETMKNAIGSYTFRSMLMSDGGSSISNVCPWSSSASAVDESWSWYWLSINEYGMYVTDRYFGDNSCCLALSRSF